MKDQQGYFDLLDWLETQDAVEPLHFFRLMQETYGIDDLIYADATVLPGGLRLHRLHHTLTPAMQRAFAGLDQSKLMPVFRAAFSSLRPLDWSLLRDSPAATGAMATAALLGLSLHGMAYPLVSRNGRSAVLSVNVHASPEQWRAFRRTYGRDIQALAALFHAALRDQEMRTRAKTITAALTAREREALAWTAAGKSYWEIAMILGISERTVRFFMANARRKLDVVSNTQAVAEALWRGDIRHPD
ncbi:helix-turn-helix transcriptional regulator [Rhizobiaceae bacterium n13]|uniref:Helix-turn-helix transcriptional regulator n=1 Tax=Ferirhizobium litorale TaxID=2927786 RepID=A0AAE3QFW3_9HYPH|nr:helix-turn-helix transcriptional regulator [Fererhizobium litorale]MDI7863882.1 helix-turn-helix transcriptional regulator [Fererhizobium litorale]MDI7924286.1 helix-turn-helix transcriptional regulator [Fererhizobium litorale]